MKKQQEDNKILKTEYYDLKRRLLGWERNNYCQLAFLKDANGMHKMFDHSAVIFVCQIAKRLKLTANLDVDTDYEIVTDKPVFLFRDANGIKKRLDKLGMKKTSDDGKVVVYDLGYKVDPGDFKAILKETERLRDSANKLILPVEVFPALRVELYRLAEMLYLTIRKMEVVARDAIGLSVVKISFDMTTKFVEAVNGHLDMDEYLKELVVNLRRLDAAVGTFLNVRLIDEDKCLSLIRQIAKTQKKVSGAMEKRELDKKRL